MGGQTLKQLFQNLKNGDVAPAYYLVGAEEVLKDEAISAIVEHALDPTERSFNLDSRRAADVDGESFFALVETPPLLTNRRVVVIRGVESWKRKAKLREVVQRYLERPSPDTVLVLVQGPDTPSDALYSMATEIRLDPLSTTQARRWANHRARQCGLTLDDEAAEHLVRTCGGELGAIGSEILKIAAALGDSTVDVQSVEDFVGVRRGETLDDLLDQVMMRSAGPAAALAGAVLAQPNVSGVRFVQLLGTTLLAVRIVRNSLERGAQGRDLERAAKNAARAVRAQKVDSSNWARWSTHWTEPEIRVALARARDADHQLKSSRITDERGIVRNLVLALGKIKEEAA